MKKNLLTVLILALVIVNLILTAIVMFSSVSANKKTGALVADIASVLNLELSPGAVSGDATAAVAESVSIEDTQTYNLPAQMTTALKKGEDGKERYVVVSIVLSMNTKDKGYKKYGETIVEKETLIQSEINTVFKQYTVEEASSSEDAIKEEILKRLQALYDGSEFIYKVSFSEIMYQ